MLIKKSALRPYVLNLIEENDVVGLDRNELDQT